MDDSSGKMELPSIGCTEVVRDRGHGDTDRSINKALRSARSVLGQINSHDTPEMASRLITLVNQAPSESKEVLCRGIVDLVFRRATRDTVDPSKATKLCAQLYYQLMQTSGQGLGLFDRGHWLDEQVFSFCIDSLPSGDGSGALAHQSATTVPSGIRYSQGSTTADGASSGSPPAQRITLFVADLYEESVFSASQVHNYVGRLVTSGASAKDCAVGLCVLLEQHGKTLDREPWKDAMDSTFNWINITVTQSLTVGRIAMRLEAIMRLRSKGWEAGQTKSELVEQEVNSLLNKLSGPNFDSVSDRIIEWANKSEQEKDGSTLMQVVKLLFEKAKNTEPLSEMYARLCRKMADCVSPSVQDETIRRSDGQPIMGGTLFRKYLLNRCQEDFERGWSAKEAATALAASKAGDDKAAEAASQANGEAVLYSEEYYAAAKAKRQGLGLVRFIGELYKLQMLTERIMHECIKKLLSNVINPEEEEIESLCKLLTTVGHSLDNAKARNHMDIYFERMEEMARGSNINSRMQVMLQDVIELRARQWQARTANTPFTAASQRGTGRGRGRNTIQSGRIHRGDHRGDHRPHADGWDITGGASAARPPAKAGDLSQFGKISKPASTLSFGPSSVFSKKDPKREASLSRANSSMNMFSALSAAGAGGPPPTEPAVARGGSGSRKPSVDLGPGGAPGVESGSVRKRLNLLPRTKPAKEVDRAEEKKEGEATPEAAAMSEADAYKKAKEDIKEYLGVENVEEAIMALGTLPAEHRHVFVDKMVTAALDGGNKVVVLAEKLFAAAHKQQVCAPETFERGLLPTVEMADDISIDVPKTYEWLARLMRAASLDQCKAEEMAGNIAVLGEPRVQPKELLLGEFNKSRI